MQMRAEGLTLREIGEREGISHQRVHQILKRGETYAKVKEYCDKHGLAVSAFIERLCREFFERVPDHRDIRF